MQTRRLPASYSSASRKDENILNQLRYGPAVEQLYRDLSNSKDAICALVKHHLRLSHHDSCAVTPSENWIRGSFNICIPVEVTSSSLSTRYMLRCPMPFKLGRTNSSVDEKLSCEVATYSWMQDNCPDIRIPFLYGFGFSDHRHFTHEQQRPWYVRFIRMFWRAFHHFGRRPSLSRYTQNPTAVALPTAYMLLEFVEPEMGQMLSASWEIGRHDPERRRKLFACLSRVMLSLARVPLPRIGSFQFNNDCTVTLTNRPLMCGMKILENDGAPTTVHGTYLSTESFVSDMITFHDAQFLSNPNAAFDDSDCRTQMAIRTLLRTLAHHYINSEHRNGPFRLQFTDLHGSNIFVNEQWDKITCLIDLEWLCVLPAEMLHVPSWITGRSIDEIVDHFEEYDEAWKEFMTEFKKQEQGLAGHDVSLASIMNKMWVSKGVWFWVCLRSVNAIRFVLEDHICPLFSTSIFNQEEEILSRLWREDSGKVVEKKAIEYDQYCKELRSMYGERGDTGPQEGLNE